MSSSNQIPTGLDASTIDAMDQLGEQTQQMLDQEIQNMQQNETSFPPELNLDLSLLSNESPMDTTQTESTQDQAMDLERLRKRGENLTRRLPRAANSISEFARFAKQRSKKSVNT